MSAATRGRSGSGRARRGSEAGWELPGPVPAASLIPAPDARAWLVKTALGQRPASLWATALVSVVFLCNGLTPLLLGQAIDRALVPGHLGRLALWILILAVVFTVNAAAGYLGRWLLTRSRLVIAHDLRMALTARILHPRGLGGSQRSPGALLSVTATDTQRVSDFVIMTVFPVAEMFSIVYVALAMGAIAWPLGLAIAIGGPVLVGVSLSCATPLRRSSGRRPRALARAAGIAADVVEGLRTLKGLGAVAAVSQRYRSASGQAYRETVRANGARARLNALTEVLGAGYVIAIAVAAGLMAIEGWLSVGQLITVVGLTQFVLQPMTMLGRNLAARWANATASAGRIQKVLGAPWRVPERPRQGPDLPQGLSLSPTPPEASALELAPRGVIVAPREAYLFAGTVADNIHPNRGLAAWALEVACGEDIPGGLDREVGEGGRALSGGQRQRIALARALAAASGGAAPSLGREAARAGNAASEMAGEQGLAPLPLILQDPTTAVDSVTEQEIAGRVARARAGAATLVISGSPAWLAVADRQVGGGALP